MSTQTSTEQVTQALAATSLDGPQPQQGSPTGRRRRGHRGGQRERERRERLALERGVPLQPAMPAKPPLPADYASSRTFANAAGGTAVPAPAPGSSGRKPQRPAAIAAAEDARDAEIAARPATWLPVHLAAAEDNGLWIPAVSTFVFMRYGHETRQLVLSYGDTARTLFFFAANNWRLPRHLVDIVVTGTTTGGLFRNFLHDNDDFINPDLLSVDGTPLMFDVYLGVDRLSHLDPADGWETEQQMYVNWADVTNSTP